MHTCPNGTGGFQYVYSSINFGSHVQVCNEGVQSDKNHSITQGLTVFLHVFQCLEVQVEGDLKLVSMCQLRYMVVHVAQVDGFHELRLDSNGLIVWGYYAT